MSDEYANKMADDYTDEGGKVLYAADIGALNGSGVSGTAFLMIDDDMLTTRIVASGLEPGQVHPQHIHGRFADTEEGPGAGEPIRSVSPTLLADDDEDGFIELAEGLDTYGPIVVPLTSPPGGELSGFPTAPDGDIFFDQTYDLSDGSVFGEGFGASDLTPLDLREIVLHGKSVEEGAGEGTGGEIDGTGGYKAVLPVASGEIELLTDNFGTFVDGTDEDDTLEGTDRADVFFYTAGQDTIADFGVDEDDRIVLANGADLQTALEAATQTEDGASLAFDDGGSLTLAGVSMDEVQQLVERLNPEQTNADDMMA